MGNGFITNQITIHDASSGMVLGDDAIGASGQVLLSAGATLTPRHIQLLSANGIESLSIREGGHSTQNPRKTLIQHNDIDKSLATRFKDNDDNHPVIKELTRICRARMEAEQALEDSE